ncbi:MAG: NAD(P)-dependent oxidoreductase [Candidatus Omnitrophota bacterium]
MNVLVTGATGFIGRHLVRRLSELGGYNIFCLVRNPKKAETLKPLGVQFVYADITDKGSLEKVLEYKIDLVFHCAAYVDNKPLELLQKANVEGTENVCELCLKLGIERLVYLSSVAVICGNDEVPLTEDLPYKATNPYGESKIKAEKIVLEYRKKGLQSVIIRPPMVYGEDEPHALKFLLYLLKLRLFPLIGKAENKFHLVYVENVVEVMIFSLGKKEFLERTFFIADKEVLSTRQAFTILSKAIGAMPPLTIPNFLKPLLLSLPYIGRKLRTLSRDNVYSIEKIQSLNFTPPYSGQESLIRSAQYLLKK